MAATLPYDVAASKVGLSAAAPALRDFLYTGGQNLDPATRAWCADFVNASLRDAGLPGTNSGMARSFLNYGTAVDSPEKGDIAVFSRGDRNGPMGHVAFVDSVGPDGSVRVLGGNQGGDHSVNYSTFPADRVLGFRRPGETAVPTGEQPAQMAAYPWTPGQQQPQQAPQQQAAQPQAAPPQQMAYAGQPQREPTFDDINKMLGLSDPPPLQFPQPSFRGPKLGPLSFRRV